MSGSSALRSKASRDSITSPRSSQCGERTCVEKDSAEFLMNLSSLSLVVCAQATRDQRSQVLVSRISSTQI